VRREQHGAPPRQSSRPAGSRVAAAPRGRLAAVWLLLFFARSRLFPMRASKGQLQGSKSLCLMIIAHAHHLHHLT
jgi:hypothetical protein